MPGVPDDGVAGAPADHGSAGPIDRGRAGWPPAAVVAVLVVLPILVLVAALGTRTWYPTGDQAQAELRMLSLPEDPPLVGAAGRIAADDGTQGNHPGPLMFWAPWPLYRLLGGSSWAFEAATAAAEGVPDEHKVSQDLVDLLDSAFLDAFPAAPRLLELLEERGWTGWTNIRRIEPGD